MERSGGQTPRVASPLRPPIQSKAFVFKIVHPIALVAETLGLNKVEGSNHTDTRYRKASEFFERQNCQIKIVLLTINPFNKGLQEY